MGRQVVLLVVFLCYHLLLMSGAQCTRNPSKEGEYDVEIRTNLVDKLSNKTGQYGDILPGGTVPIQRNTNTDLIRDRQVSEATKPTNRLHTYLAVGRTKGRSQKYSGGGGNLKVDNPKAVGQQYSANRLRLHAGYDSIEVGWRVDPDLYGDSLTRFYIRTDGAKTHCFNTLCPGFVLTKAGFSLDFPCNVTKSGGDFSSLRVLIVRDNANGNWILKFGENRTEIGYWPPHLFNGLAGLADLVEWGGAVYSPPGTPLPPMGMGRLPSLDLNLDGAVADIKVLDERGHESDALDIETYADDRKLYDVGALQGLYFRHIILFGGPGHDS